jgi:uncharacterized protein YbaP (TraB family)
MSVNSENKRTLKMEEKGLTEARNFGAKIFMRQSTPNINIRGVPKMKNKTSKLFAIGLVLSFVSHILLVQEALSQSQKSFLWRVQSKTNTVYVLGSLHYSKKEIYPLSEKIEKAFGQSEILVVEADINDIKKLHLQKLMDRAFYPDDDTLEKHVAPDIYGWVVKETGGLGIPVELLNKQKPWFLAITLVALESLKLGFDPNLGIDKYFLSKAEGGKKILELESLDYQLDLLSTFSDKDQELFLSYTLKDLKILEQELGKLTQAWTSGDTKAMESILTKSVSEDGRLAFILEKLVYERNRKMVSKIEDYLKEKETYFVMVGAGHLVGDRGIIEILKGKGYLVEQL